MFKKIFKVMAAFLLLAAVGQLVWASVNSEPVTANGKKGEYLIIPLKLISPQMVGGINGELTYDPTLFSNPTIISGNGSNIGMIALGNQVSAGHFKFVVYSDKANVAFDINQPVAFFQVKVAPTVSQSQIAKLTFQTVGACDIAANTLGASFAAINVKLLSNGVNDWALYE